MRQTLGIALLFALLSTATAAVIPLENGVIWTYEAVPPVTGTRIHAMSGPGLYQGLIGFTHMEAENGVPGPTTHWARGDGEQVLLQGVDWGSVDAGGTWYFSPAPVFIDPGLAPGQAITTTAGVFEVTDSGDQWYGNRDVTVTCLEASVYNVPGFGDLLAVTLQVDWPASPGSAPWAYGRTDTRTYANHVGLVRIENRINPAVAWELVSVVGLDLTAAPSASLGAPTLTAAPTPFNPATVFRFDLRRSGRTRLDIHDVRGRRVDTLVDADLAAGLHEAVWQPRGLASGTYLARLVTGRTEVTTRVMLVE